MIIERFRRRYGDAHWLFACHAALPLTLTTDLLYCIRENFTQDFFKNGYDIPWSAISDLLLSGLCEEVDHEQYEMEGAIRSTLLNQLKTNWKFGETQVLKLAYFLSFYVSPLLQSSDLDIHDFAQAQQWTSLAYINPTKAAQNLAVMLSISYQQSNYTKLRRISSIVEALEEPLADYESLLIYARGMARLACENIENAQKDFERLSTANSSLEDASKFSVSIPNDITFSSNSKKISLNI